MKEIEKILEKNLPVIMPMKNDGLIMNNIPNYIFVSLSKKR